MNLDSPSSSADNSEIAKILSELEANTVKSQEKNALDDLEYQRSRSENTIFEVFQKYRTILDKVHADVQRKVNLMYFQRQCEISYKMKRYILDEKRQIPWKFMN